MALVVVCPVINTISSSTTILFFTSPNSSSDFATRCTAASFLRGFFGVWHEWDTELLGLELEELRGLDFDIELNQGLMMVSSMICSKNCIRDDEVQDLTRFQTKAIAELNILGADVGKWCVKLYVGDYRHRGLLSV